MTDGDRELFNEKKAIKGAGVYTDVLKKLRKCQELTGKYTRIWTAIRVFDSKHKENAYAVRCMGYYATLPTKADMGEMRGLLAEMGALREGAVTRAV